MEGVQLVIAICELFYIKIRSYLLFPLAGTRCLLKGIIISLSVNVNLTLFTFLLIYIIMNSILIILAEMPSEVRIV